MSVTNNPWTMAAQALPVSGDDPHLADGVHVRVQPWPQLGFPRFPFAVYRVALGEGGAAGNLRADITWIADDGELLQAPFEVTPDRGVTGFLPGGPQTACCWIRVLADRVSAGVGRGTPDPLGGGGTPRPTTPGAVLPSGGRLPDLSGLSGLPGGRSLDLDAVRFPQLRLLLPLQVTAIADQAGEVTPMARRSGAPYDLGASRIDRVRVEGTGTVKGVQWLDAFDVVARADRPWRIWALPIESAVRYQGVPQAAAHAWERVERGAPRAFGLQERPDAASPQASPPIPAASRQAFERDRVAAAATDSTVPLRDMVQDVMDSPAPHEVVVAEPLDADAVSHPDGGGLTMPALAMLMQAATDTGVARWLGLMDRDEAPPASEGEVVAYVIAALFEEPDDLEIVTGRSHAETLHVGPARLLAGGKQLSRVNTVVAACTIGAPPDRPGAPEVGAVDPGQWIAGMDPDDPRRSLTFPLDGLVPGAAVGVARRVGAATQALNAEIPVASGAPRRALLLPSPPSDPSGVRLADVDRLGVTDSNAPTSAYTCRVAQTDLFGRWSAWGQVDVPPLPRPAPPPAVVQAEYAPASVPAADDPQADAPLAGRITGRVRLPPALPTGALPLAVAELEIQVGPSMSGPWTPHADRAPAAPFAGDPSVTVAGPPLERCATAHARLRARWKDTDGTPGPWSEWASVGLFDPRQPPQIEPPDPLRYGARPDALGFSRITLEWQGHDSHAGYRVFYADETRLRRVLGSQAPAAGDPAPSRAQDFIDRAGLLEQKHFTLLTAEPVPRVPGRQRFVHQVSGALEVLTFFRVVAVGHNGSAADFGGAPLVARGVPNDYAPARPLLERAGEIEIAADGSISVPLTMRVPRGGPPAARVRLRRSRREALAPLGMPVAKVVELPADAPVRELDLVDDSELVDLGVSLAPWNRYSWVVEVQAPPQAGTAHLPTPTRGKWSEPSPPVTAVVLGPAEPPADGLAATREPDDTVRLRWKHGSALAGGDLGAFRFDVYRQLPGDRARLLTTVEAAAPEASGGRDAAGFFRVHDEDTPPRGTTYRVVLLDPLGRAGAPAATAPLT